MNEASPIKSDEDRPQRSTAFVVTMADQPQSLTMIDALKRKFYNDRRRMHYARDPEERRKTKERSAERRRRIKQEHFNKLKALRDEEYAATGVLRRLPCSQVWGRECERLLARRTCAPRNEGVASVSSVDHLPRVEEVLDSREVDQLLAQLFPQVQAILDECNSVD
jgi:hypothetical protein